MTCPWYKRYSYPDDDIYEVCIIVCKDCHCQSDREHCTFPAELDAQERADAADWTVEHEREGA